MKRKKDYTIVLDLNQDEVPAIINLTDGTVKPVPKRKNNIPNDRMLFNTSNKFIKVFPETLAYLKNKLCISYFFFKVKDQIESSLLLSVRTNLLLHLGLKDESILYSLIKEPTMVRKVTI